MTQKKFYLSIIFSLLFSYANAAIIYVDNDSQGSNNGQTWANAYHSLNTALLNANFGDIIRMDKGTYLAPNGGFVLKDGVKIYGGYNVRYNSNGNLVPEWLINATRFFSGSTTIIEGISEKTFIASQNVSNQSVLDGLTIDNSYTNYSCGILIGNISQFDLTINNCIFEDFGSYNVGICLPDSSTAFSGSLNSVVTNSTFKNLKGIRLNFNNQVSVNLEAKNCKFSDNLVGIELFSSPNSSGTASITATNSLFRVRGIAIVTQTENITSSINVYNSIFTSTVNNNTLSVGVYYDTEINIFNSSFYDIDGFISQNTFNSLPVNFNNCIFWNTPDIVKGFIGAVSFESCLFDKTICPTVGNSNVTCTNSIYNQNPQFVSTNPSDIDYLKLSSTSPARNAGNNTYATGRSYGGNDRILESTVDIGAYEFCPRGGICRTISSGGGGPVLSPKIATKNIENNIENLLVYPNPVKDIVKVKSSDTILSIELINVQGQVIYSIKDSNELNIANAAKGMYMLRITTDKGTQTKRIIKE